MHERHATVLSGPMYARHGHFVPCPNVIAPTPTPAGLRSHCSGPRCTCVIVMQLCVLKKSAIAEHDWFRGCFYIVAYLESFWMPFLTVLSHGRQIYHLCNTSIIMLHAYEDILFDAGS